MCSVPSYTAQSECHIPQTDSSNATSMITSLMGLRSAE